MNGIKVKAYKKVLKEICNKFDGVEGFISRKIGEYCSHKNYLLKRFPAFISFFCSYFVVNFFSIKIISLYKI